jgi:FkbM family methyltransferase
MSFSSALHVGRRLLREIHGVSRIASPSETVRYVVDIAATLPRIIRARTLMPADQRAAGRVFRFRVSGTQIELPGDLFSSAREIYGRGVYFAMPQFSIHPGDTVVDLGANQGVFTVLAGRIARKVIAIEAQSGFCKAIQDNAKRNDCSGAVVVEFGILGSSTGIFADNTSLVNASHYDGVRPPELSMSDVLQRNRVDRVDFLKIDIEGSEFALLRDAAAWLPTVRKIAMEVHTDFGDPSELEALLKREGFETALLSADLLPARRLQTCGYLYAWRSAAAVH